MITAEITKTADFDLAFWKIMDIQEEEGYVTRALKLEELEQIEDRMSRCEAALADMHANLRMWADNTWENTPKWQKLYDEQYQAIEQWRLCPDCNICNSNWECANQRTITIEPFECDDSIPF